MAKILSVEMLKNMSKGFVEAMENGQKLMKIFNYTNNLIYDIAKFCSDGRRTRRNKIKFVDKKLKEYKIYIETAKPVKFVRFKPLAKGDRN